MDRGDQNDDHQHAQHREGASGAQRRPGVLGYKLQETVHQPRNRQARGGLDLAGSARATLLRRQGLAVDLSERDIPGEVVAAQPVVVYAGDVRHAGVKRRPLALAGRSLSAPVGWCWCAALRRPVGGRAVMRAQLTRRGPTWSQFLCSRADAILACDFFSVDLLDGTQAYVLAVVEHATRRIRILGGILQATRERSQVSAAGPCRRAIRRAGRGRPRPAGSAYRWRRARRRRRSRPGPSTCW